jgi:hypothetical protein
LFLQFTSLLSAAQVIGVIRHIEPPARSRAVKLFNSAAVTFAASSHPISDSLTLFICAMSASFQSFLPAKGRRREADIPGSSAIFAAALFPASSLSVQMTTDFISLCRSRKLISAESDVQPRESRQPSNSGKRV